MTRLRISHRWAVRLSGAVVIGLLGFVATALLDFEPHPLGFTAMVLLACSVAWLVMDTINTPPAVWRSGLPPPRDREDEASADNRILTTHQQATEPTGALSERLVALARARNPTLAVTLHDELSPVRRIRPAEIDRILTRIEESSDHH